MTALGFASKVSSFFLAVAVAGCASADRRADVPDVVLQHTLSSLTRDQSFSWTAAPGEALVIRPLGTFKSGENYCRDFQYGPEGVAGDDLAIGTACRIDDRWTTVDPSTLDL